VPTIILTVYIWLSLFMSGSAIEKNLKEMVAFSMILVGFATTYLWVVNTCHEGTLL
jgi:hypothetical protein